MNRHDGRVRLGDSCACFMIRFLLSSMAVNPVNTLSPAVS